ncbi:MAG: Ppx/GppA family phosphatase [Melioribacteraceae bacterium]|nr:Ppx/GppA family phosphatase [Melioribacteraceae bacterium]MCF8265957.1 Ppx/GppA family phosphatase [Melioribacteraceae bacterium]MCF8413475.1 Ppx/GppA family phosphatase [Melioribacteraceae bacterium]
MNDVKTVAAIDMGTNSFHLIVASTKSNGSFEIIDREKEVIRLGEGNKGDIKIISEESIQRAVLCLNRFKGIAQSYNAEIKAIATSATRESANKREFIERVYEETNLEVEVISGIEEARLIYLGILQAVPIYDKLSLCIDIGGGSTEFIFGRQGKIEYSNSLKLGAVRLTQLFFQDGIIQKENINRCRDWVKGELVSIKRENEKLNPVKIIGSSGTIISCGMMIAEMKNENIQIANNYCFSIDDLKSLEKLILKHKTTESRKSIPGLDEKRTDIIPAGIILLTTICAELNITQITISDYALREGIIIDSLNDESKDALVEHLDDIRLASVTQLSQSSKYDRDHCIQVSKLALLLFDELFELHGLSQKYRDYLKFASILHDIGYHISHSKHHKHSEYIIRNSELLGFTENDIYTIASTARYHRKSHPKKSHSDYMNLPKKNREVVKILAGILRIADSLDRTHSNIIKSLCCKLSPSEIVLEVISDGRFPEIEFWNLERRKALIEENLGRKLSIQLKN